MSRLGRALILALFAPILFAVFVGGGALIYGRFNVENLDLLAISAGAFYLVMVGFFFFQGGKSSKEPPHE